MPGNQKEIHQTRLEGIYGARYSILHDLSYFDPVRMHDIDPMHNILYSQKSNASVERK